MAVFVNRTLNLKTISLIGFDMDYTLVSYDTKAFESLTYEMALEVLVDQKGYPDVVKTLTFDFDRAIVGLIIDRKNGFLLQASRYGKVKTAYFGLELVPFQEMKKTYQNMNIDLSDPEFLSLDTSFAISHGVLFSQLVQLKKDGQLLPDYHTLEQDVHKAIDQLHRDGSLKSRLQQNFSKYVISEPRTAQLLERYKEYGKKLMIITNSDYAYTKVLLEYAIDPYLKKHASWKEVFDLVVTFADKPRFFERQGRFLKIDPETGLMANFEGKVTSGIFQGGSYEKIEKDFNLNPNQILYIGDHIYGDVVSIKKQCGWRTALVLGDLEREIEGLKASQPIQDRIDNLMVEKSVIEKELNTFDIARYEGIKISGKEIDRLHKKEDTINSEISELLKQYLTFFNPYWGEILRAGSEESRYAEQVERYACIYMTKVADLADYSTRTYFRPVKRIMPHELAVLQK